MTTKTSKRDQYTGVYLRLLPQLAQLYWIVDDCRPYSGSARHNELADAAIAAISTGMTYMKYACMLARTGRATMRRMAQREILEQNFIRSETDWKKAQTKALAFYTKLNNK